MRRIHLSLLMLNRHPPQPHRTAPMQADVATAPILARRRPRIAQRSQAPDMLADMSAKTQTETPMASSLFLSADELMVRYARYHRDQRNISTHMVGVPMIVFGLGVLLSRGQIPPGSSGGLSLAWLAWGLATVWYLGRGHLLLGLAVSLANAMLFALAHLASAGSVAEWLSWGLGFFGIGWIIQFIGHYYEGKKPAFADDLAGLLVGPMFVTAELLFLLGLARPLAHEIERRAGPTVLRDLAHPVG
jgi:uncharacterized membrane protein YGL010W